VRYRRRRAQADTSPGSRWLVVEVPTGGASLAAGASSPLALALSGGRRIEVGQGFDAQTLVQLLRVLEKI
jgi:hypothetical protein